MNVGVGGTWGGVAL